MDKYTNIYVCCGVWGQWLLTVWSQHYPYPIFCVYNTVILLSITGHCSNVPNKSSLHPVLSLNTPNKPSSAIYHKKKAHSRKPNIYGKYYCLQETGGRQDMPWPWRTLHWTRFLFNWTENIYSNLSTCYQLCTNVKDWFLFPGPWSCASWQCHCTLKCWKEVCQARTKSKPSHYNCTHTVCPAHQRLCLLWHLFYVFGSKLGGHTLGPLYSMSMKLVTLNPIHILDEIVFLHYNTMDSTDIFHTLLGTATDRLGQQLILPQSRLWSCWHGGLFILLESFHISLHLI